LAALFSLMLIIAAFEKLKILDMIATKILTHYTKRRYVSLILIIITFISAMFITNDVALITFVPITLIIARKSGFDPILTVILQTLAANIGSSLTPMGNPQNLYLYSYYNIDTLEFLKVTGIFTIIGIVWVYILNNRVQTDTLNFSLDPITIEDKKRIIVYSILFALVVASILRFIDYKIALVLTLIFAIIFDRKLIKTIDYFLLGTFICFFVIIGNLSSFNFIKDFMSIVLHSKYSVYIASIGVSQVISNVPAAILLSGFTKQWQSLLLGVNIGGMGTIIASLASVISYKYYAREYKSEAYIIKFHLYNFISLLVFTTIFYFFI
jgi:Na+/H+ antiporter NhaD/arsenite permease-like protein